MRLRAAVGLLWITLSSGCAYTATTSLAYRPIPVSAAPSTRVHLIVKPLSEARPPRSYPTGQTAMMKTYIPLLPYVEIPYERLDETSLLHEQRRMEKNKPLDRRTEHFTVAIARAIAGDLSTSGLFGEVELASDPNASTEGAYVLDGDLRSTEFEINATSYMLGFVGVLLWLVPIPCGWEDANVQADLRLTDPQGRMVWQDTLSGRGRRIFTFYNAGGEPVSSRFKLEIKRYGENDEGIDGDSLWAYHASAIRSGMEPVKKSLAVYLGGVDR